MKTTTKQKLKKFLYEISPKEERETLIFRDNIDVSANLDSITRAIKILDETQQTSEQKLMTVVVNSINGVKEDVYEKIEEHRSNIEVSLSSISALYTTYSTDSEGKTQKLSKEMKEEIEKHVKHLKGEMERVSDLIPKMWGGSSRQFYINSTGTLGNTASPQNIYSDINLISGAGISITSANNNQGAWADVTISVTGGSSGNFTDNEVVSGSGTSWTLASTPIINSQHIYANGQRLTPTVDYTISGKNITTLSSWVTGTLLADYRT